MKVALTMAHSGLAVLVTSEKGRKGTHWAGRSEHGMRIVAPKRLFRPATQEEAARLGVKIQAREEKKISQGIAALQQKFSGTKARRVAY